MIETLGVAVGAVSLAVFIFMVLRKRELSRPALEFRYGLSRGYEMDDISARKKRLLKKLPTTSLLFAVGSKPKRDQILAIPFLLRNTGKLPIRNVVLRLQYPADYFVDDEKIVGSEGTVTISKTALRQERNTQVLGSRAHVDIPLGLIRPDESIVTSDWLCFPSHLRKQTQHIQRLWLNSDIPAAVWDLDRLVALCTLHVQLLSEDLPGYERKCRVILLDASTLDEIREQASLLVRAFWNGKFPTPGVYWIPKLPRFLSRHLWPNELIRFELAELVDPQLRQIRDPSGRKLLFELPWESARMPLKFGMPPWLSQPTTAVIRSTEQLERLFYLRRTSQWVQKLKKKRKLRRSRRTR